MGYNTSKEMVERNYTLLSIIKMKVEQGLPVELHCPRDDISRERWLLRQTLTATEHFKAACGGEFAGLGARVLVTADFDKEKLIVKPRSISSVVSPIKISEHDALSSLLDTQGSMTLLEFYPSKSFSMDFFLIKAKENGWLAHAPTYTLGEDGKASIALERLEKEEELGSILSEFQQFKKKQDG